MARYQQQRTNYPMGSVISGTMREEDLIPAFISELNHQANRKDSGVPAKVRKSHLLLIAEIESRMEADDYYESEDAGYDLNESLFDALGEYAGPYFYFGAHPGDGSDYGFWLSESWDEDFEPISDVCTSRKLTAEERAEHTNIKVSDLSEVPDWFCGEVAVVNDHGNCTLYVKTSRTLREIWSVV